MKWLNYLYAKAIDFGKNIEWKPWVIGNQVFNWDSSKVFIHVPAHFLIGLVVAWFSVLVFPTVIWTCFAIGCTVGITRAITDIVWKDLYVSDYSGIGMNVFDGIQYCLGASTVLLMLI